jgi:hypothetical protein
MLGYPNRIDAGTLSNGSWTAGLPRANIQDRRLGQVARTSNAALASTVVDIDLGSDKSIRSVAAINHNFSLAAKYRLRGSAVSNFATTVYDSGSTLLDVWPVVYPAAALDWEDDNWWSGKYTAEQISGYTTALVVILSRNIIARYWRLEIDDTTNAAGYLQLGRIFIGPVWQPTINMNASGASLGWETKTEVQESLSGAEYFQRRTPFRVQRFALNAMTADEGLANAFEIQRRAGIDKEILFIHDPSDTVHALRRRFLARLRQLTPIEYPYFDRSKTAFEVKELL